MDIKTRLSELRTHMSRLGIDYYLIPSADPHKSEYVPDHWQRRRWISNFTGSAGDVLVTLKTAYLWTDPRYFLQAETELNPNLFQLMKISQDNTPSLEQWLLQQPEGFVFAVDSKVITIAQEKKLHEIIVHKKAKFLLTEKNLIDQIWKNQPSLPTAPIQLFENKYSGLTTQDKIELIREIMQQHTCHALVITTLDAIAWILNIRGKDIDYNPLVISNLIITDVSLLFFVDLNKLNPTIKQYFSENNIFVHPYEDFKIALQKLPGKIWLDPNQCNAWVQSQLSQHLYLQSSPINRLKAIKNNTEQQGMRQAHLIDAIAMVRFLYWLETHWQEGVTELSAAAKLNAFRLEHTDCLDLSFTTISGFAEHGAIVHYAATHQSNKTINDTSLYLVDSGGQYRMGTTDVTRTIHLGQPTPTQIHHYSLVLKGHLALSLLIFPDGTCGEHINAFARAPLWKEALDYGHGTGHGVGCYSCVHEFPPSISARHTGEPLKPGMVVSNEPGLYLTNQYGIRIENCCLVTEIYPPQHSPTGSGPFYGFEDLTLVPYCRQLIEINLLTPDEIKAINQYHQKVFITLQPHLEESALIDWLRKVTSPLQDTELK